MGPDQRALYLEFRAAAARARGPARQWAAQFIDPSWSAEAISAGQGYRLGFGLARIIDSGGGLYEPAETGGLPALLFPVWDCDGPAAPYLGPEIIDLAAWLPATGQTLRRTGLGDVLGADAIDYDDELRVFASPIAWANASGQALHQAFEDWEAACQPAGAPIPADMAPFVTNPQPQQPLALEFIPPPTAGVVVLDWEYELLRLRLWGPRRFIVDDIETGRRLRDVLLGQPVTLPEIAIIAPAEGIAA